MEANETVELKLWAPTEKQLELLESPARFKVIVCGRRFGKTTCAVNFLLEEALMKGGLYFYAAPTYRQGKMIAWEMLMEQVRKLPSELVLKVNESELSVIVGNGGKICIKGAEDPDSLRGVGLMGCVLDEYADMHPDLFEKIIRPALLEKKGWCWFIGTPKGFNHFYTLFNEASTDLTGEYRAYRYTSYDNPWNDPKELEVIRSKTDEDVFAQEYLADFRKKSGLVYKGFRRELHGYTGKPTREIVEVFAGLDFGFTNPAAGVIIGRDSDNHFWQMAELYERGLTNDAIIQRCKGFSATHNVKMWYPDNAEPDRVGEMTRAGLPVREVNKSMDAGIDRVRELINQNRYHLNVETCPMTLWELETYSYEDKRKVDVNAKEEPLKKDDHAMDALRYALFTHSPADFDALTEREQSFQIYNDDFS